jgi:hypothetical protein
VTLIKCPDCGKDISDQAPTCPSCGRPILPIGSSKSAEMESHIGAPVGPTASGLQPSKALAAGPIGLPVCQHCNLPMKRKVNAPTEGIGCLLFIGGIPVFLFVPGGIAIAVVMGLIGLVLLVRRKGVWRCKKCGVEIPRHMKWYEM